LLYDDKLRHFPNSGGIMATTFPPALGALLGLFATQTLRLA